MAILDFGHPTGYRWLLIVPAEQQFGSVAPLHILQYANPVVHRGTRISRKIVDFLAGVDFKCGCALRTGDATLFV